MDYQELYAKYQAAIKLRELNLDEKFVLLKEIFLKKIVSSISVNSKEYTMAYLAGLKDVFSFVDSEIAKIESYKSQLEKLFDEK